MPQVQNNTAGSTTWNCPNNVTRAVIELWGAGGGGGGGNNNVVGGGGGGGGGGAYARIEVSGLVPGNLYAYVIPAGGAAGSANANGTGGAVATFNNNSGGNTANILTANGGGGGIWSNPGGNGAGGVANGSGGGITSFAGGRGNNQNGASGGGGGGAAAGNANAGADAASNTRASGANGGGSGGNGGARNGNGTNANNAGNVGGGGGGAGRSNGTFRNGGVGGNGQILITYTGYTFGDAMSLSDGPVSVGAPLGVAIGDGLTMADGTPSKTFDYSLDIACPHLGQNWLDVLAYDLQSAGGSALTLTLSDNLANWSDDRLLGYGFQISDQAGNWSDQLRTGYGFQISDQDTNWADMLIFGYGFQISDSVTMTDSLQSGYGLSASDQMSLSDLLQAGYGMRTSDQIVMVDSVSSGYGFILSDSNVGNWADQILFSIVLFVVITDQDTTWADSLLVGYGNAVSDAMTLADSLGMGYGFQISDQDTNWADVLGLGYGLQLSDQDATWSDAVAFAAVLLLSIVDQDTTWNDLLGLGYGDVFVDSLSFSDTLRLGYGLSVADTLTFSDVLQLGYGLSLSDSIATWADALSAGAILMLSAYDTLWGQLDKFIQPDDTPPGPQWASDTVNQVGHIVNNNWGPNGIAEAMIRYVADVFGPDQFSQAKLVNTTADWFLVCCRIAATTETAYAGGKTSTGPTASPNYQIIRILSDAYVAIATSSTAPNVGDVVRLEIVGSHLILYVNGSVMLTADDGNIANGSPGLHAHALGANDPHPWTDWWGGPMVRDALGLGYGFRISDQLVLSEQMGAGYGFALTDQLALVESVSLGYGLQLSDTLNNWADLVATFLQGTILSLSLVDQDTTWADGLGLGYGNAFVDQFVFSDALGVGYGLGIKDQDLAWADQLNRQFDYLLSITDTATLTDSLQSGYGLIISDQLTLADSLRLGYGLLLSDNLNNWADLYGQFLQGTVISLAVQDIVTWTDVLGLGYGLQASDQIQLSDFLGIGYGLVIGNTLNNWLDQLSQLMSIALIVSDSGAANWSDALRLGYGLQISDQATLTDAVSVQLSLQIQLSDTLNNWLDAFNQLLLSPGLLPLSLTDSIVTWSDTLKTGYGLIISDQLIFGDALAVGYGLFVADIASLQDGFQLLVGQNLNLTDALTLSDSLSRQMSFEKSLSDGFTLADVLGLGTGMSVLDQMSLSDFLEAGYGLWIADQLQAQDSLQLTLEFDLVFTDSLDHWADLLAFSSYAQLPILLNLTDSMYYWQDVFRAAVATNAGPARARMAVVVGKIIAQALINTPKIKAHGFSVVARKAVYANDTVTPYPFGPALGYAISEIMNLWQDAIQLALN